MSEAVENLRYLGEALGVDAIKFLRARNFFEDIELIAEQGNYEQKYKAMYMLEALELVTNAVRRAPEFNS